MNASALLDIAVLSMCAGPSLLLALLALRSLLPGPVDERVVVGLTALALTVTFAASLTALAAHEVIGTPSVLSYGTWFSSERLGFAFDFLVDRRSLGFAALATGICGVVAAFSSRYLHREAGFQRYFVQLAMFALGITLVAVAGSIEVLLAGWEFIGLSSALLVGFFHERPQATDNALRVFVTYRVSDAAMFGAVVLLHHWAGSGSLSSIMNDRATTPLALSPGQVLSISMLIITAVAAKSALFPFSGWLPRAMEGPTPSSAVYYGALSIHAGCFLLLRFEPLLAQSLPARLLAGAAGVTTAVYATVAARVQSDIKSALAYASLTQVGIIVLEISVGLTTLAFAHLVGHACFRLLQFLSAPNVLHELHELENRLGEHDVNGALSRVPTLPASLFLFGLERGFIDSILDRAVVSPFRWLTTRLDWFDRLLCGNGTGARRGDRGR